MTRQTFPDSLIWANNAPEIDDPDAAIYAQAYESGSGKTPPKAGVHNNLFNRSDLQHQHVERNGVPRWDARTIYALGGWCLGSDHMLYRSKTAGNTNHDPTGPGGGTYWRSLASISMERVYPVGSMLMRPTNPGSAESAGGLGFGTWIAVEGLSPIGVGTHTDGNGTEKTFNQGNTDGEYEHTLTPEEMPNHDHHANSSESGWVFSTSGSFNGVLDAGNDVSLRRNYRTGPAGGDEAHNNLHPVFAVHMWYRTS